ncbi:putative Ig domain-containing protein [Solirubrobacter pauli]|uniref:Putative Ig domain-containing protein n=1 Tax=Solirubrobacter pauli TaxID=166793 RepID=A0A660LAG6_9ACTN|nr:putative Ig domain-containing protein [Solirubrobacter pauli]RKQ91559.1 putative Ig domain-containing protein [Solirubrobacter pauli]
MRPTRLVLAASTLLALALPAAASAAAPLCSPVNCATATDSTRTVVLKPKTKAKKTTSLRVSVKFAPTGSTPKVTVTGPGGFKRKLSTTKTYRNVKPGRYVVTAEPIKGTDLATFATYRRTVAKVRKHAVGWVGVRYRQQVGTGTLVAQPSAVTAVTGDPNGTRTVTVQDPQGLIKVGSVLTAGVGPKTPGGMLVEVKSVTRQGDLAIAQADPAPLTAIGPQAEIISQPQLSMTAEDFARVANADPQADPGAFKQGSALKKLPDGLRSFNAKKDGGADKPFKCSSRAGAKLTGDVSFDAGTSVGVAWGGWLHPGTIKAHVGVTLKQAAKLKVEVFGEAKCELELELLPEDYRFTPWSFTVGPVPVVIVPKLNFLINGEAEIAASTAIEVDQSLNTSFGLAYDGDNFGPYGEAKAEFKTKYYEPAGSMNLKASVGPRLAFDFYDVAGPYLTAGIFMQLKADTDKSPWWRLSSGLQAGGGLRFKVWKFGFDYNKPDIWSKDWTVAQAKTQAPIALDGKAFPAGDNGVAYAAQVKTTRGTGKGYYVTDGALPAGLALNRTTGAITGTPTAHGTSSFQISVVDGEGKVARKDYAITIRTPALALTTTALENAQSGSPLRVGLTATGSTTPYTWTLKGDLPRGVTFDGGQLLGTPTQTGTFAFTVTVTGGDGKTASRAYKLTVLAPPLVIGTAATLPDGMDGVLYEQALVAEGGEGAYTWTVASGTLPAGVTLDPATGKLSGRPTAQGDNAFTVKVADTTGHSATKAVTLKVYPPGMVLTAPTFPTPLEGDPFSATLTALGGTGPYTWAVTAGALPGGLSLNAATGAITGTTTAGGTFAFTVTVTDSTNAQATKALQIDVTAEPSGTPVDLAALDCWSANGCMAVGFRATYLYDGTTWTKSADVSYYNPEGLSCFSATRCVMTGGGDAYTWDGSGSWTSIGRPAVSHGGTTTAVRYGSCFTATRCEIFGDEKVSNVNQGYSWRLDSGSWGRSVRMPNASYYGFDCLSATFCAAVQAGDGLTTFDGTSWSALQNTGLYNTRVSCSSTTSCMITGGYNDNVVRWSGSLGAPTSTGAGSVSYAVDCVVGGTFCAGFWRSGTFGTWDGTTWTKSAAVAGLVINDIECTSATKCIGVGNGAKWYVWDGTSWARQRGFAYN